jgi:hypothetical protein
MTRAKIPLGLPYQNPTKADKVILATNAYTAALYPPAAEFIIPTRAQVAAIRPGSNIADNPALE